MQNSKKVEIEVSPGHARLLYPCIPSLKEAYSPKKFLALLEHHALIAPISESSREWIEAERAFCIDIAYLR